MRTITKGLAIFFFLVLTAAGSFAGEPVQGDVNGDGVVNAADAVEALKVVSGKNPSGIVSGNDVNGDAKIGLEEAVWAMQKASSLREAASTAVLAGSWDGYSLASGPGAPWWERATGTINGDGYFYVTTTYSQDSPDVKAGVFTITPCGIVTIAGDSGPFQCTLDSGKTFMACTDTWSSGSPGTTEMKLFVKKAASYSLADLAGVWENNALASGPGAPWWNRGPITVNADGSFSGTLEEYPDETDSWSGTFQISTDGVITFVGHPSGQCSMDASKTIIVCAATWSSDGSGTTELRLMTKKGTAYAQSDLTGTWYVNDLASGNAAPWWGRSEVSIDSSGSATITTTESDGDSGTVTGKTVTISSDGIVTADINLFLRCTMNSAKTVIGCTSTWTDDEWTTELSVFTKAIVP